MIWKAALFGIPDLEAYCVVGILLFFGIIETAYGLWARSKRTGGDWMQEAGGFVILSLGIKPAIVILALIIGKALFPGYHNSLIDMNMWLLLPIYLFSDDFLQYWYHRKAHEIPFLWKLHRAHHQAEEMGYLVTYRNAAVYFWMMPNIWIMGLFTFLGGGLTVAMGIILKQIVIVSAHSTVPWDKPFYKNKFLRPIILIIERIFVTPAFHHAHHGRSKLDGVSDPNSNFGNMFALWDQLFGTAVYTHAFPEEYGLHASTNDHWTAAYLYPFFRSKDPKSELSKAYQKLDSKTMSAINVDLKKGEAYLWCSCGLSKTPPFCDGSHHGSSFKPLLFEVRKDGNYKMCNCKLCEKGPFCDDSHLKKQ